MELYFFMVVSHFYSAYSNLCKLSFAEFKLCKWNFFLFSGDFKKVTLAIKALSSQQVENFMKNEQIELEGHVLVPGDLRIIYQFARDDSK